MSDQGEAGYTRLPRIDLRCSKSGESTDVISISVARKSEGTIVLKEIIVIFIVLRDCVWGFGMVHRFVREMAIVYEVTKFG